MSKGIEREGGGGNVCLLGEVRVRKGGRGSDVGKRRTGVGEEEALAAQKVAYSEGRIRWRGSGPTGTSIGVC